jgi:hypothetical protein
VVLRTGETRDEGADCRAGEGLAGERLTGEVMLREVGGASSGAREIVRLLARVLLFLRIGPRSGGSILEIFGAEIKQ